MGTLWTCIECDRIRECTEVDGCYVCDLCVEREQEDSMDKTDWVDELVAELNAHFEGSDLISRIELVLSTPKDGCRVWEVQTVFTGYPNGSCYKAYKPVFIKETDLTKDHIVKAVEDAYVEWLGSLG